jgi:hypothetical protein
MLSEIKLKCIFFPCLVLHHVMEEAKGFTKKVVLAFNSDFVDEFVKIVRNGLKNKIICVILIFLTTISY